MNTLKKKIISIVTMLALFASLVLPYTTMSATAATVNGSPTDYSLTINKLMQSPLDPANPEGNGEAGQVAVGTPIEDVKFELVQTHAFDPATNAWTEVVGATPIEKTTDATGKIVLTQADGLQLGRYTVQEVDGPANVVLDKTGYSVDIPMTSKAGDTLNYKVVIQPKNEKLLGAVELTKVDENNAPLAGAEFELFKKDNTQVGTVYTTNADGKVYVDGLEYGEYYFKETKAPTGFLLDETPITFSITKVGKVVVDAGAVTKTGDVEQGQLTNYPAPVIKKDVETKTSHEVNRDTEYTYNITLDVPKNIKDYQEFVVTDLLDPRLTYANNWTVTGIDASNLDFQNTSITNAENKIQEQLVWTVKDLALLDGVTSFKISFKSKIKPDAVLELTETGIPNTAALDFDNGKGYKTTPADRPTTPPVIVTPSEGGLKVIKVDAADNNITLAGAEFKLTTDKAGNDVIDATGTVIRINNKEVGLLENLTTNADGEFVVNGLSAGTYYLHETKAPVYKDADGNDQSYRILTAPLEVIIPDEDKLTEVTVENSKVGWNLPKTGGVGTMIFTVIGLALMAFALIIFKRKRKEQV